MLRRDIRLSFNLVAGLLCTSLLSSQVTAAQVPSPPITDRFSVQMFQGKTQNCWIAVYPPLTYTDGTVIKDRTPVNIKVYRSLDEGKTYDKSVTIVSGGHGFVGQGEKNPRKKPWIDCKLETPVNNQEPYAVYLAVSSVVDGVESEKVNRYLTFRYREKGGRPRLIRYENPDLSGEGVDDAPSQPLPQELPGKWGEGEFVITRSYISPKLKQQIDSGKAEGCDPAVWAALDQMKGKPMPMEMRVVSIDLDGVQVEEKTGTDSEEKQVRIKTIYAGTLRTKITPPIPGQGESKESDPMDFVYDFDNRRIAIETVQNQAVMQMRGYFYQTPTRQTIQGSWKMSFREKGIDMAWIRGTWFVKKRKAE